MAFKMKGSSLYGKGNQSKSPTKVALKGGQENLPEGLKDKIEASPGKMYGSPNKNMKDGDYKQSFESPAKMKGGGVKVDMNDPKIKANYKKHKDNPKYRAAMDKKAGGKFSYDEKSNTSTTSVPQK